MALNAAEQHLDAGTTAMLVNIGPMLIAVFAGLLLGEGFPRWLIAGIAVAFAGRPAHREWPPARAETDLAGVVLCLLAAVAYAVGVVSQKRMLRRLSGLQVAFTACAIGRGLLPAVGRRPRRRARARPPPRRSPEWSTSARCPRPWRSAPGPTPSSRMDAGNLGVTTYLVPPVVVVLGWLLLDEVPPGLAFVGGAMCLSGSACPGGARGSAGRCGCRRRPARPCEQQ